MKKKARRSKSLKSRFKKFLKKFDIVESKFELYPLLCFILCLVVGIAIAGALMFFSYKLFHLWHWFCVVLAIAWILLYISIYILRDDQCAKWKFEMTFKSKDAFFGFKYIGLFMLAPIAITFVTDALLLTNVITSGFVITVVSICLKIILIAIAFVALYPFLYEQWEEFSHEPTGCDDVPTMMLCAGFGAYYIGNKIAGYLISMI